MEPFDFIAIFIMLLAFGVPILRGLWARRMEKQHPELVAKRKREAEEAARGEYRQIYSAIYGDELEEEAPQQVIEMEEPLQMAVEDRTFETPIQSKMIQPTTVELDEADQGKNEVSSSVQIILGQLNRPSDMVILHEVLGLPRALNNRIY